VADAGLGGRGRDFDDASQASSPEAKWRAPTAARLRHRRLRFFRRRRVRLHGRNNVGLKIYANAGTRALHRQRIEDGNFHLFENEKESFKLKATPPENGRTMCAIDAIA